MDIKIKDGDMVLNENGTPVMIEGLEMIAQQLRLAANVTRGTFIYDRDMGLDIDSTVFRKSTTLNLMDSILNELVVQHPQIKVISKGTSENRVECKVIVEITDGHNSIETEVKVLDKLL